VDAPSASSAVDACVCQAGWAGAACDSCAAGFVASSGGSSCQRPATSTALQGLLRVSLAGVPISAGTGAVGGGASVRTLRRVRALAALRPSEGLAVDALVTALNTQVPLGTLVSRISSQFGGDEVSNGWLNLKVSAADASSLDAALGEAAGAIKNTSSPVHTAMKSAGLSAVSGSTCTGSLCFAGGPSAVSVEALPTAFSGLAGAQLEHQETLGANSDVTLRWGLFSPPGAWASCVTWPAAAAWPAADGAALRGDTPLAMVIEMSHASALTWLGVGFPSSPTGGMLGATAVIAQAGAKLGAAAAGQGVRIPSGAETCPAVLESLVSSLASGTASHFLEGRTSAGISAGPLQRALVASAAWSTALGDVLPPFASGAVTAARFVLLVAPPSAGDSDAVNGVVDASGQLRLLWAAGGGGGVALSPHGSGSRGELQLQAVPLAELGSTLDTGVQYDSTQLTAHVLCMVFAWLVCTPAAMLLALLRDTRCVIACYGSATSRSGPSGEAKLPRWLCSHIVLQLLATAGCVGGTVAGVLLTSSHVSETHHYLGWAVMALVLLQVCFALCRPDKHLDAEQTCTASSGTGALTRRDTVGVGESLPTMNPMAAVSAQKLSAMGADGGVGGAVRAKRLEAMRTAANAGPEAARNAWEVCHRGAALLLVPLAAAAALSGAALTAYAPSTQLGLSAAFGLMVVVLACAALWRAVAVCQDSAARRADAVRVGEAVLGNERAVGSQRSALKSRSGKHSGRSRASLVGVARGANGSSRFQLMENNKPMATHGLAGGVSPRRAGGVAPSARASLVGGGYAASGLAGGFSARRKSSAARRLSSMGRRSVYARMGQQLA